MDALEKLEDRKVTKSSFSHSELIEFANAIKLGKKIKPWTLPSNWIRLTLAGIFLLIFFFGIVLFQKKTVRVVTSSASEKVKGESVVNTKITEVRFFTINLAAYTTQERAYMEVDRILALGTRNQPFVYPEHNQFQVCLGQFQSNAVGYRELLELRRIYGDKFYKQAFVRIIKQ